jgi:alpha-ketoglutarate-dependent taurine dioxygenase
VEALNPRRDPSRHPLFQVKLILQNAPLRMPRLPGLVLDVVETPAEVAHSDLILYLEPGGDGLQLRAEYSTDLFEQSTVENLLGQFEQVLRTISTDTHLKLSDLRRTLSRGHRKRRARRGRAKVQANLEQFLTARPGPSKWDEAAAIRDEALPEGHALPRVLRPAIAELDAVAWAVGARDLVDRKLHQHGALLFRDFKITELADFQSFSGALGGELMDYNEGSTPRTRLSGKVYTSTEYPPHQHIPLHNEMSYSSNWPAKLWFFCAQPAAEGGATPICDSREVFRLIPAAIRDRFMDKGICYVRNFGQGLDLTWQQAFRTEDPRQVEAYCRQSGIEFHWHDQDRLTTRQTCGAAVRHPHTGDWCWFNQAHLFHFSNLNDAVAQSLLATFGEAGLPRNAYHGDGTPLNRADLDAIRSVYARVELAFPWRRGDVLLLDNMLAAHGRHPFSGNRKIVVAMTQPCHAHDLQTRIHP